MLSPLSQNLDIISSTTIAILCAVSALFRRLVAKLVQVGFYCVILGLGASMGSQGLDILTVETV